MLVISQKVGDKIQIGRDITLEVLQVSSGRVKLGLTAPKEIKINRLQQDLDKKSNKEKNES